jgi:hypothetical protein
MMHPFGSSICGIPSRRMSFQASTTVIIADQQVLASRDSKHVLSWANRKCHLYRSLGPQPWLIGAKWLSLSQAGSEVSENGNRACDSFDYTIPSLSVFFSFRKSSRREEVAIKGRFLLNLNFINCVLYSVFGSFFLLLLYANSTTLNTPPGAFPELPDF